MVAIKSKLILIVMSFIFLLAACTEESKQLTKNPENALKMIKEDEDREIKIYGTHKLNENLSLIVFKGAMNDKDIWVADVQNKEGQWVVKEIFQMNGPIDKSDDIQTTFVSDEFGYEVGYIKMMYQFPRN